MGAALTVHPLLQCIFKLFKFCPFCMLHRGGPPAGSSCCPLSCSWQEKHNFYCSLKWWFSFFKLFGPVQRDLSGRLYYLALHSVQSDISALFCVPACPGSCAENSLNINIWKCGCGKCSLSSAKGTHSVPGALPYCPHLYHAWSQAKVAGGIHEWTRRSRQKPSIKRKIMRNGSRDSWPTRNVEALSECVTIHFNLNLVRAMKGNRKGFC